MAIRFTCEVSDPHTQAVIQLLGERLGNDPEQMLKVILCAKKWLELECPTPFAHSECGHMSSSLVTVDDDDVAAAHEHGQKPFESLLR